jgi:hypothetical protein
MSVPAFLSVTPYYQETVGVSDVSTIITNLGALLTSQSPAWTLLSGVYYSPADSGRQFNITMTRTNAYTMTILVCQGASQAVQLGPATLTCPNPWSGAVRLFCGQFYIHIDIDLGSTTPVYFCAGVLDLSPEAQNAHTHFLYANATAFAGSSSNADISNVYMFDNATATYARRRSGWQSYQGSGQGFTTPNGARIYRPSELWCIPTGGGSAYYLAGRQYNCLMVPSTMLSQGDEITVPVDVGVTGVFKACGGPVPYAYISRLLAMRKS